MTTNINDIAKEQMDTVNKQNPNVKESLSDGLVLVDVLITGRDGEKTLDEAKIFIDDKEIQSRIARKTRIEWFPRSELQFKNTAETQVRRAIARRSVRYGRYDVTPVSELDALADELEKIGEEFYKGVEDRANRFEEIINQQKHDNPELADIIDKLVTQKDDFFRRFTFKILPPMVFKPFFAEAESEVVENIVDVIIENVVNQATIIQGKILGKSSMIQRTFEPVRAIRNYIFSMSFTETQLDDLVEKMDEALAKIPLNGTIENADMVYAANLIHNLTDKSRVLAADIIPDPASQVDDIAEDQIDLPVIDAIEQHSVSSASGATTAVQYEEVDSDVSDSGFFW